MWADVDAEFNSAVSLAVTRFGYCCKRERDYQDAQRGECWHLGPLSCPHNSLAVIKPGPSGIYTVSSCSRSQRVGKKTKEGGRGRLSILGWAVCKLFHLTLSLFFVSQSLSSVVVFPPGSMGKHGAVDGLLCCLLSHLAHHPHCPRHAGPGKLLSINICQSFQ